MDECKRDFGILLKQARERLGLSQRAVAGIAGLSPGYVNRLESGERSPGAKSAMALAGALQIRGVFLERWLESAGCPGMSGLLGQEGGSGDATAEGEETGSVVSQEASSKELLDQMLSAGILGPAMSRYLEAVRTASEKKREISFKVAETAFENMVDYLESPVRFAVIPAAGGLHRVMAVPVMQRLIFRAVQEAANAGIWRTVLVLPPGTRHVLHDPLKMALDIAKVPGIQVEVVEQQVPLGLGDAVLRSEPLAEKGPFAVILPDDWIERPSKSYPVRPIIKHLMAAFEPESWAAALVVAEGFPKKKLCRGGVARLAKQPAKAGFRPVQELSEKPDLGAPILDSPEAAGILGRYVLSDGIFARLKVLRSQNRRPLELTDAIGLLIEEGEGVFAVKLKAERRDYGYLAKQIGGAEGFVSN